MGQDFLDFDLFSDETLADPYPTYAKLREIGPAVYLEQNHAWALTQYAAARAALVDHETFSSVGGVALNRAANEAFARAVLLRDPPEHAVMRRPMTAQLGPREVASVEPWAARRADELVAAVVRRGRFDAVRELAEDYVCSVMSELIGLPAGDRDRLLLWGRATFDMFGPPNARTTEALGHAGDMIDYVHALAAPGGLRGGWGAELMAGAHRGDLPAEVAVLDLVAYVISSVVTTIHAIGNLLWLLAARPDEWRRLRADPARVPAACNEALRLEAPAQLFGRRTTCEVRIGDAVLPADAQVIVLFASANRDERKWGPDADVFDADRPEVGDHLAFSRGPHSCVGIGVARMKMCALLAALVRNVDSIELDGPPVRTVNNLLRGFTELPVRVAG